MEFRCAQRFSQHKFDSASIIVPLSLIAYETLPLPSLRLKQSTTVDSSHHGKLGGICGGLVVGNAV
jgi:hypothetical protein